MRPPPPPPPPPLPERERDRQTDRQADRDRQTDRQRHTDTQTEIEREGGERESCGKVLCVCVCALPRERERERQTLCVCTPPPEREREKCCGKVLCVCAPSREREREKHCGKVLCVCTPQTDRHRERERERERERNTVVKYCVCVCTPRAAGLKCEKIEGYAKGQDYQPGTPLAASPRHHKHSWNAVLLNGQYHFVDASFGAVSSKCFVEHFFMTPPNEMRLSHFPRDKRWLLMTHSLSLQDFEGSLKTWPTMFAFNIRPLNMRSVLRSYDGKLSITVLLRNVAVFPQLEYVGPGTPQDAETLAFNVDQEIRSKDNAETFHLNLPEEGTYFFTLMVHDLEGDADVPAFQYRVEYQDELL